MANKFLSVLASIGAKFELGVKKALQIEAKALPVEQEVAGAVSLVNPAAGTTLSDLLAVVGQVEQVATAVGASSGTGPQKLAAALPGVEAAISSDPLFAGKTITDVAKYNFAISAFASALVDIANSFASTTPAPAPPATQPVPAIQAASSPAIPKVPSLS